MKKKGLALALALTLLVVGAAGGTLAWLTAKSDPMVNTFTTSDIGVTLKETTGCEYKMIPGWTIQKDPKATVTTGSEECYLFVKLDKSSNFDNYLEYTVDTTSTDKWTKLDDESVTDEVYYRIVHTADMGKEYSVLSGDKVTVKGTVTKEMMNALGTGEGKQPLPTLTVTAYASQLYKGNTGEGGALVSFTALEAWTNISTK